LDFVGRFGVQLDFGSDGNCEHHVGMIVQEMKTLAKSYQGASSELAIITTGDNK
jgi:hypothetical protein